MKHTAHIQNCVEFHRQEVKWRDIVIKVKRETSASRVIDKEQGTELRARARSMGPMQSSGTWYGGIF